MTRKNLAYFSISNSPGTSGNLTVSTAVDALHVTLGAADDGGVFSTRIFEAGVGSEIRSGCTYTHGTTTLTRGTLESSTSGSALNFTSAAKVQVVDTAAWGDKVEKQLNRGVVVIGNSASVTQSFTAGASTKVADILDTVTTDELSWWSVANKRFQPTRAGIYFISGFCSLSTMDANKAVQAQIFKNGSVFSRGDAIVTVAVASAPLASVFSLVPLNGISDYVELFTFNGDASNRNNNTGVGRTGFQAVFLS